MSGWLQSPCLYLPPLSPQPTDYNLDHHDHDPKGDVDDETSAPTTALYVPPTPHSRQPTPTYKHDDVDNHDYHDVDHDDGDHPNLIGESVVEIRKLGDHQQPWRTTFANLSLPLGSLLLVTSVFKCVGQLMVVVVVVMVDLEVVTDVILFLFGFLIVAQLETQPD